MCPFIGLLPSLDRNSPSLFFSFLLNMNFQDTIAVGSSYFFSVGTNKRIERIKTKKDFFINLSFSFLFVIFEK